MTISRRTFVSMGVATAVVAVFGAFRWRRRSAQDLVVAILERRVGYLRVDTSSFRTFAAAYVAGRERSERRMSAVSVLAGPLRYWSPYAWLPERHAFRQLEDSIVSNYLLSTDFFEHHADEGRIVNYVGIYNPFESVCRNPFARQAGTDL